MLNVLRRVVTMAAAAATGVGLGGLLGWLSGSTVLTSVVPGRVPITPVTAICFVSLGAALWLMREGVGRPTRRAARGARLLAAATAIVGLLNLLEYFAGWGVGAGRWLVFEPAAAETFGRARPDVMAPLAALNFLLLGLALLVLDQTVLFHSRRYWPAHFLAFVAATASFFGLLDFVLGSGISHTGVALQTPIAFVLLAAGVVCARPGFGLAALLASSSLGGMLTRRLWPAVVAIPILLGTVSWNAYSAGWITEWSGITLLIVAMITLLGGLTVWNGHSVDRAEAERQAAVDALRRREEELREAQRLARVGSWWWDPATDALTWSEELYRIAGRDPALQPPRGTEYARFYAPAGFARLTAAMQQAVETGSPFELDLEIVRADGTAGWVTSRGEVERDAGGAVVLVRGTVEDITERKRAEEALRESEATLNRAQAIAHIGSWRLDLARDALTWSDEVYRIFGVPIGSPLTYQTFLARVHPEERDQVARAWAAAMSGAPYDIEHRIIAGGELKWVRERARVEFDQDGRAVEGVGTVQDITARKHAEQELRRVNRAHRALSSCNQALIRATDEAAWLERVCRIIVDEAGHRFCWVGRAEHDESRTVTPLVHAGYDEGYLETVNITWADTERGRGPTGACIRTGEVQVVNDIATDPRFAPWRADALRRGYLSSIAIPLFVGSAPFGALSIYSAEPDAFHREDVQLLKELADDLGFGIATLRARAEQRRVQEEVRRLNVELEERVSVRTAELKKANALKDDLLAREQAASAELAAAREREVQIGYRIQQMLLLTRPPADLSGLQVAALTIPSQSIDGDFYDFIRHGTDCLDVVVADVMGKGVPAALLAAATKSNFLEALCHLTAISRDGLPEPREIVTLAHVGMVRQLIDLDSFVTLSYVRLDLVRRRLQLVDCGHTGMMMVSAADGRCEVLHGSNLPLGIREGEIFEQVEVPFAAGDLFVLYSDGITEMRSPAGELFGSQRLGEFVRANRTLEPAALVAAIREAAVAFAGTDRPADDLTCVAVRVFEPQGPLTRAQTDISSGLAELRRARDFVRAFCGRQAACPLAADDVAALELAVNEAASNVMKHAYHGRADQRIQLDAELFPDRIVVRLHHVGDAFDPAAVAPPVFDGSRESGFGLYLIARSVDEVSYCRDERGRHCIALVKAFGP